MTERYQSMRADSPPVSRIKSFRMSIKALICCPRLIRLTWQEKWSQLCCDVVKALLTYIIRKNVGVYNGPNSSHMFFTLGTPYDEMIIRMLGISVHVNNNESFNAFETRLE